MSKILNSWKEIAGYVGRGVRTVQRWECDLHFPVRRPRGRVRSAGIALTDEIDHWMAQCAAREAEPSATWSHHVSVHPWEHQSGVPKAPESNGLSPDPEQRAATPPGNGGYPPIPSGVVRPNLRANIEASRALLIANRRLRHELQNSLTVVYKQCELLALQLGGSQKPQ